MMRSKKMPFDAFELDVQQILRTPTDPKTVLIRVMAVLAAAVVLLLIFDYYWTEKSQVARFLERRWEGAVDQDKIETILDGAGHIRRRVVFQAPRRAQQQNIDWNKRRWQEAIGAKLPLKQEQP